MEKLKEKGGGTEKDVSLSPVSRTALSLAKVPWSSEDPHDRASCMLVRESTKVSEHGPCYDQCPTHLGCWFRPLWCWDHTISV